MLAAAGVLKLIDEQVTNAVADSKRGIGWQPSAAVENALGNLRDLDEVHAPASANTA